jgi:hypothetical protein
LRESLADFLPEAKTYRQGIYKCRVVYSSNTFDIEITPYFKRKIKRLKIVNLDTYPFLPPAGYLIIRLNMKTEVS